MAWAPLVAAVVLLALSSVVFASIDTGDLSPRSAFLLLLVAAAPVLVVAGLATLALQRRR